MQRFIRLQHTDISNKEMTDRGSFLEVLLHGSMMLIVLLSSLTLLWGDALNQWYDAPFVDICSNIATLAVYRQDEMLQWVLFAGAGLALVIAIVLQIRHTKHLRLVHVS